MAPSDEERPMELSTSPPATTTERNPWVVLGSTSLAVFAVFLDTTILFVAFPSISTEFSSASPSSLSWVLNAYTIVFAALLIPFGRLADRVGRRRTFLTAAVAFTIASMLCGLAPTVEFLVAARVLQGVAAPPPCPPSVGFRGGGRVVAAAPPRRTCPLVVGARTADVPTREDPRRCRHLGCGRC